jgi:hypothetical protein
MNGSSKTDEAMDFLLQWYGDAPHLLTAIKPDGGIETKSFWPQHCDEMKNWICAKVAARWNLYYSINQPGRVLDKKADKSDIRLVRAFHVDIDPDNGETPEQCKARACNALASFSPPPSTLVDSGNGIQALWLLEEPILLNGDEAGWRRVEAFNIALGEAFGADHCHNIDRIFRLPGTINFPNKKKRALGRSECPAKLLPSTWLKYPVSAFPAASEAENGSSRAAAMQFLVRIPASLPRYASTDDLPVRLEDYTASLIVNGGDPCEPSKYPSRSEVLWRVLCDMVRAGAEDETIAAVILDADFQISASVLDKPRPEQYAAAQISKARDEVEHPALRELNERHAIIETDRGGRCVVMEEDWDEQLCRRRIIFQTFENFRNRYMRRFVEVGSDKNGNVETMPLGKWWLQQARARQYRKIEFLPGREVPGDVYNLWKGFGCEPREGVAHLSFLSHIREVLCRGDEALANYVIRWIARMVQYPGKPAEVALVLRGKKGTGKGFFGRALCKLLGQHSFHCASSKYVTGSFNAHLRDCVFLFADEAFLVGNKSEEGLLKALITEPTIAIEAKGVDAMIASNCLHILIASNEDYIVPASGAERRFAILQADDSRMQDTTYFSELQEELDNGGMENLLHFLLEMDLNEFDHRAIPRTEALLDQAEASMLPRVRWVHTLIDEGFLPNNVGQANIAAWSRGPNGTGMLDDANDREPTFPKHSHRGLATILMKLGCKKTHLGWGRGMIFPPLPEMRAAFEREYGPQRWSDPNQLCWLPHRSTTAVPF